MADADLLSALVKVDKAAKKQFFERFFPSLSALSQRYAKNLAQSRELLNICLAHTLQHVIKNRHEAIKDLDNFVKHQFIKETISFLKQQRNEYYVASTVRVTETSTKNYDLFKDNQIIDFNTLDVESLLRGLRGLVPSQRLVFNLHVIEGYSLRDVSELLETSEQTVKSNLEKSRYNLQKNLETTLKAMNNEHAI